MSKMIGTLLAVAGDGRRCSCLLSDPQKQGLKPNKDHTRRGNQARTTFNASARILKQSNGSKEGALE